MELRRAEASIPGGVNSPLRAFRSSRAPPIFVVRAAGAHVYAVGGGRGGGDDERPRRYIDWQLGFGPHLLGHAAPPVVAAMGAAAADGLTVFGAPSRIETRFAEAVRARVPSAELLRLATTGTEATMTAVKLARSFTGRRVVLQFAGQYHGHSPSLMAASGGRRPGADEGAAAAAAAGGEEEAVAVEFNDAAAVRRVFRDRGGALCCVIVEPVGGNMGGVRPAPGFLPLLRRLCSEHGALLIFDEVMTGFRCAAGSAGEGLYGVTPDLITLGKALGGGLPVAAVGGRRDVMRLLAPDGPVYHAGTHNGNGVALAAGLAALGASAAPGFYAALQRVARDVGGGIRAAARAAGVPVSYEATGGLLGLHFAAEVPRSSAAASRIVDAEARALFQRRMLEEGVLVPQSPTSPLFVSAAHSARDVADTVAAAARVFAAWPRATPRPPLPTSAPLARL